nr:TPA_inf: conotoxin precursor O1 [Conus judaeus]
MKLTCVMMIVAALLLTACQLSTAAGHGRGKQEDPAGRWSGEMQDFEDLTLAKKCKDGGDLCNLSSDNCCSECIDEGGSGVCAIVPEVV